MKNTILIFIIGYVFEYFLQPFPRDHSEHLFNYEVISLIHIGVAATIYFIYFLIMGAFINGEDWKIFGEIIALFFFLVVLGTFQWLIRDVIYDNPMNWSLRYLIEEIWHSILAGAVVFLLIFSFTFNSRKKRRESGNRLALRKEYLEGNTGDPIKIETGAKADHFFLDLSELLCIKSDGNYLDFYLRTSEGYERVIKRLTLQSAADQLIDFPFILRTHRAFLVNLHHVIGVKGNAQGYQLSVKDLDFEVPVSRKHIHSFDQAHG